MRLKSAAPSLFSHVRNYWIQALVFYSLVVQADWELLGEDL